MHGGVMDMAANPALFRQFGEPVASRRQSGPVICGDGIVTRYGAVTGVEG